MSLEQVHQQIVLATLRTEYEVKLPVKATKEAAVEALRQRFHASINEHGPDCRFRCEVCEEDFFEPPDEPRDECPFCGCAFTDDGDVETALAVAEEQSDAAPVDAASGLAELDEVLRSCRTLEDVTRAVQAEYVTFLDRGYRLGWLLKTVRDRRLWEMGGGYTSFRDYHESIGVKHATVFDLIKIVECFSYQDFLVIGRAKLAIIASVPPEYREELLAAAQDGASKSEIKAMANEVRSNPVDPGHRDDEVEVVEEREAVGARLVDDKPLQRPQRVDDDEEEEDGPWATIVTKIKTDVPVEVPFLSRKRKGDETNRFDASDVYLERILTPRIAVQIDFNTDAKGKIVSANWTFRRTE